MMTSPRPGLLLLLAITALLCIPAATAARTFKIATVVPEGSAWMREMRGVAKEIKERTEGRVTFKFYPGGVMGNDQTVLRKIRAGQLQGGAFTSGALNPVLPDIALYGIPLLFRSYEEVDYVRSRMDAGLRADLEKSGLVALAITDSGFAYLMSQKPARQVSDLKHAKVWIQEGDVMSQTAFEIAGVSPVQLPLADVYTGLQTRLVDTVASPPMGAIALQWHTRVKYLTDVPLTYLTGVLAIDARAFSRLGEADRLLVSDAIGQAARRLDAASRDGEAEARRALMQQGIEFVTATTATELQRWHDIAHEALVKLRAKGIYSESRIQEIQRLLADYRRQRSGADGER